MVHVQVYMYQKRISPLDDEAGVFADEVLFAEDEEGSGVGGAHTGKTYVVGPLGHVSEAVLLAAKPRSLITTARVCRQPSHPARKTKEQCHFICLSSVSKFQINKESRTACSVTSLHKCLVFLVF